MVKETPKILLKALRQYAHNTRVGDLFAGFDYDETVKIVESLEKILADTIVDSNDQRHNFVMSEIKVKSQAKEIEGLRENINSTNTFITEILDNYEQYSKYGKPACDLLDIIQETLSKDTTQPDKEGDG